jgi:hypothetical protein
MDWFQGGGLSRSAMDASLFFSLSPSGLSDPDRLFERHYDRATFGFRHDLSAHPLLSLASLKELTHRLGPAHVYWSNGAVNFDDRWEKGADDRRSPGEIMDGIEASASLVMLRSVVNDPIVGPLMRDVLTQLVALVGPKLRDDIICARATILIASPHRITPYHIDADVNFLMQIAGSKLFCVHDGTDRTVITDAELEAYFAGDANAAIYREARRQDARHYALGPGDGAHVPALTPHWAENGDEVSIAISFNFDLRSAHRVAAIHKINRRLRQIGGHPTGPRMHGPWDGLKHAAYRVYETTVPSRSSASSDAGWTPSSNAFR